MVSMFRKFLFSMAGLLFFVTLLSAQEMASEVADDTISEVADDTTSEVADGHHKRGCRWESSSVSVLGDEEEAIAKISPI